MCPKMIRCDFDQFVELSSRTLSPFDVMLSAKGVISDVKSRIRAWCLNAEGCLCRYCPVGCVALLPKSRRGMTRYKGLRERSSVTAVPVIDSLTVLPTYLLR